MGPVEERALKAVDACRVAQVWNMETLRFDYVRRVVARAGLLGGALERDTRWRWTTAGEVAWVSGVQRRQAVHHLPRLAGLGLIEETTRRELVESGRETCWDGGVGGGDGGDGRLFRMAEAGAAMLYDDG